MDEQYSEMTVNKLNDTIDNWISALADYTLAELHSRPSPNGWSLGQVYIHLIDEAGYHIEQIKTCISNNDNAGEITSPEARALFDNDGFPDITIEGPLTNVYIPQPASKEQLADALQKIKTEVAAIGELLSTASFNGKTKHPGLGYFNAEEWIQFSDIHFRHHLRQKRRIDIFLGRNK